MATFSDTILQAIFNYRQLLKRQLKPAERRAKFQALGLNAAIDPTNEQALYELGQAILADLKTNSQTASSGYYSYSGIQKFIDHLQTTLDGYELKDGTVIHKAQQASRALLHAIQLLMSAGTKWSESLRKNLAAHSEVVAKHGSEEQRQHFCTTLKQFLTIDEIFLRELLQDFENI